jgi:hypothetical protein
VGRQATRFHSTTTGLEGAVFGRHTMVEVLERNAGGGAYGTLGQYMVAALLNAAAGHTPFLSESTIRRMWNDLLSKGSFEPTPGVKWGLTEVTDYLRATMR